MSRASLRFSPLAIAALHTTASFAQEGTQAGGLANAAPPAVVASECGSCHSGSRDDQDRLFRPFDTWAGTMMANAMRDPLFLAALSVAEQDLPGSGAYCLRCHTPKGYVKGHATGTGAALDADDQQGVECEACHRSIDGSKPQSALTHDGETVDALGVLDAKAPYIGNARLIWDPRDVRHGPHSDADSPAHAAAGNPFTGSSELCGQCHEVLSPAKTLHDAKGADTGIPFPLDTTYSEWKASAYAQSGSDFRSCIDCHMLRAKAKGATTASFPSALSRDDPRTHTFVGGNEWGIDAVMNDNPSLAIERAESFELAKAATRDLLSQAVSLEIRDAQARAGDTYVTATVRVTNQAGHKFPSGYADGRRAFLQIELLGDGGQSLGVLGKYDDATQRFAKPEPLRVWESIQAEHLADGSHREWHIVKNDTVVKDNRIPPRGFSPSGVAAKTTAPVGADYGTRHYDDVAVRIEGLQALPLGELSLVARVYYQSTMREFVEELERANVTDARGSRLRSVWENTGRAAPRLIQSQTASFSVDPAPPAKDEASCACRARGGRSRSGALLGVTLALAFGLRRRGRR